MLCFTVKKNCAHCGKSYFFTKLFFSNIHKNLMSYSDGPWQHFCHTPLSAISAMALWCLRGCAITYFVLLIKRWHGFFYFSFIFVETEESHPFSCFNYRKIRKNKKQGPIGQRCVWSWFIWSFFIRSWFIWSNFIRSNFIWSHCIGSYFIWSYFIRSHFIRYTLYGLTL